MKVSVIIPVKNGAHTLGRCLQNLQKQTIANDIEIIILDSMSSDGSRQIALENNTTVIEIPFGTFNHGLTRNLGAGHAKGELVFFTVQDAWLAEDDILEKMSAHFNDPAVMAVVGHQAVPNEKDKNPVLWFRRFSKPEITRRHVADKETFEAMSQGEKQKLVAWDNVVAMYRRTALLEQPFVLTQFAEDWIWSETALKKGWTLLHDPSLVAWHYHHYGFSYSFKVAYAMNYHFYSFMGYVPAVPALITPMMKSTWHLFKNPSLNFRDKIYWAVHNYARLFGTWLSHVNFLWRLRTGGKASLERGYKTYNKTVPQGKQKR